jgi:hypothetical protein
MITGSTLSSCRSPPPPVPHYQQRSSQQHSHKHLKMKKAGAAGAATIRYTCSFTAAAVVVAAAAATAVTAVHGCGCCAGICHVLHCVCDEAGANRRVGCFHGATDRGFASINTTGSSTPAHVCGQTAAREMCLSPMCLEAPVGINCHLQMRWEARLRCKACGMKCHHGTICCASHAPCVG